MESGEDRGTRGGTIGCRHSVHTHIGFARSVFFSTQTFQESFTYNFCGNSFSQISPPRIYTLPPFFNRFRTGIIVPILEPSIRTLRDEDQSGIIPRSQRNAVGPEIIRMAPSRRVSRILLVAIEARRPPNACLTRAKELQNQGRNMPPCLFRKAEAVPIGSYV